METERDHVRQDLESVRAALQAERKTGKKLSAELDASRRRIEAAEADAQSAGERAGDLEQGLEKERQAHERTRTEAGEARAVAVERVERLKAQDKELQALRVQIEEADGRSGRLEADLEHARQDLETAQGALGRESEANAAAQKALADLRIEVATLAERAAHVEELRALVKTIQEQQGRAEGTGKAKAAPKRRSKPEG